MPIDVSVTDRLERALEKVADTIDRMKDDAVRANNEQKDLLHAIQRKTDALETQLTQNTTTTAETRALVMKQDGDIVELKEWRTRTDSALFDTGGMKDQVKANCEDIKKINEIVIPDGRDRIQKIEEAANKRQTIWEFLVDSKGAIIGIAAVLAAIVYIVQAFTPSPPSTMGRETNSVVKSIERKIEQIEGGQ